MILFSLILFVLGMMNLDFLLKRLEPSSWNERLNMAELVQTLIGIVYVGLSFIAVILLCLPWEKAILWSIIFMLFFKTYSDRKASHFVRDSVKMIDREGKPITKRSFFDYFMEVLG